MKFVFVCCIFMVAILNDVQAQNGNIVAADQNVQNRASDQGVLIIDGVVAANAQSRSSEQGGLIIGGVVAANAQSRSSDQVVLIIGGIVAAEQSVQNRGGQNQLQSVVHS